MNCINFIGNVGRDGETRYLPNGNAVLSFSVALSSGFGDKKITTWLNCSLFGKRAESLEPYIKKGVQVGVTGEFQARPYPSKDGTEKLNLEVRADNVTLIGGKDNAQGNEAPAKAMPAKAMPASPPANGEFDVTDDIIPF